MNRLALLIALASAGVTAAIGLWMAQPWEGSPPYDRAWGFLLLAGFLAWASSPLLWLAYRARRPVPGGLAWLRTGTVVLLGIGGCALMADAAFVHIDAQSALVMLVLPVYQWPLGALSEALTAWLAARQERSAAN